MWLLDVIIVVMSKKLTSQFDCSDSWRWGNARECGGILPLIVGSASSYRWTEQCFDSLLKGLAAANQSKEDNGATGTVIPADIDHSKIRTSEHSYSISFVTFVICICILLSERIWSLFRLRRFTLWWRTHRAGMEISVEYIRRDKFRWVTRNCPWIRCIVLTMLL